MPKFSSTDYPAKRIPPTFKIVRAALKYLKGNKKLVYFPLLTLIGFSTIVTVIMYTFTYSGILGEFLSYPDYLSASLYLIMIYVAYFFCVRFMMLVYGGMVYYVLSGLKGNPKRIRESLGQAFKRHAKIVKFSTAWASIGIINRSYDFDAIAEGGPAGLEGGIAWELRYAPILPIIIWEDIERKEAKQLGIKRLKTRWGDRLKCQYSFAIATIMFSLVSEVIPFIAVATVMGDLLIHMDKIIAAVMVLSGVVLSTSYAIFMIALYVEITDEFEKVRSIIFPAKQLEALVTWNDDAR